MLVKAIIGCTNSNYSNQHAPFQHAFRLQLFSHLCFATAPDPLGHVPSIRAAFGLTSNTGFPAEDAGFLDLISNDVTGTPRIGYAAAFADMHGLSLLAVRPDALLQRLLNDPVACALAFEEDVALQQRLLNGHSYATDKRRKTLTRAKLRELAGVFGVCSAALAVVECNGACW